MRGVCFSFRRSQSQKLYSIIKEGKKKTKFELWVGHFTMWVQAKNDGGSITVSLGEGSRKQW